MGYSRPLIFFILPIILGLYALAIADDVDNGVCTWTADYCWSCSHTIETFNHGSIYERNFHTILSFFSSNKTEINSGFYNFSLGQGPEKVNAMALCRGDVPLNDCHTCFNESISILWQNCTNKKQAIIWAQRCTVHYSNVSISSIAEDDPVKFVPGPTNAPNAEQFKLVLNPLLKTLSGKAAAGDTMKKFAAGHALVPATNQTIYAIVQCTPDLDRQNCSECLDKAISDIRECCEGKQGGRVLRPSCNLRFESNLFYDAAVDDVDNGVCTLTADYCWSCSRTIETFNNGSIYERNLYTILSSFNSHKTEIDSGFYNFSLGQDPEKVNAMALCRGDVSPYDCHTCFNESISILRQNCTNKKQAIIWAQRCMVHYSNVLIFGVAEDDPVKFVPSPTNAPNAEQFKQVLNTLVKTLSGKAAAGDTMKKFAAGHALVPATNQTVYAIVQCTPDLDRQNCSECLDKAISDIPQCCEGKEGGRVLRPRCNLRFESNPFYDSTADDIDNGICTLTADYCWSCSRSIETFNNGSNYERNLHTILSPFSSNKTKINSGFYNFCVGQGTESVNAMAVCRGDVPLNDCHTCFKESISILLQNCTNKKKAIIWAQHCTVHYSNVSIFGVTEDAPVKFVPGTTSASTAEQFKLVLNPLMKTLSGKAAAGDTMKKFAAGHALVPATNQTIYAIVQCTPDLDRQNCSECLDKAISDIRECCEGKEGGRVLRPSCNLRFECNPFYDAAADSLVNLPANKTL